MRHPNKKNTMNKMSRDMGSVPDPQTKVLQSYMIDPHQLFSGTSFGDRPFHVCGGWGG